MMPTRISTEPTWFRYGRAALGGVVLALGLIALGLLYASGDTPASRDLLVNQLFINAIFVVGLQLFIGNTGIMSFGHLGFATIAGYVVAILTMPVDRKLRQIADAPYGLAEVNMGSLEATLIAVAVVLALALLLSLALTRSGQGVFAATIITLALLEIIHTAAVNWNELTDGATGLGFIPRLESRTPILIVLIGCVVLARLFSETRIGRWAKAAREDDTAANILGVDARWPRMVALLLSVAMMALGASLKVQDIGSMTPRLMFFDLTLLILAMLIVGGRRSVTGALLGVLIITIGNEVSRIAGTDWSETNGLEWLFRPTLTQLFLGAVMLGTMLFRPDGLLKDWELDYWLRDWWRRKEQAPSESNAPPRPTSPQHTLKVQDVVVDFKGFRAVNKVSLEVNTHEIVGLIGPNGAGKTTLLNAITGFVPTSEGRVFLDDTALTGRAPHQVAKAGLARTFQNLRLFKGLSVRENIAVMALTQHAQADAETDRRLVTADLWDKRHRYADQLDYGHQRRLELARAAAKSPLFLLLDEPTSGMSDQESAAMIDHVRQTAQSVNAGVLVIDHDLHFITQICDRVYVLDYGTLIATGTPDEIKQNDLVRAAYLGQE
jgi:branched-chain amino acid transport system permease protein